MATKSTVISLPIQPLNQTKHSDVCQYLDNIQDFIFNLHFTQEQTTLPPEEKDETCLNEITSPREKDEILKNVKVPLCGDLLGRERITGAKKTRLGCDWNYEKFSNIIEYPALWHTKQSFLSVSKKFLAFFYSFGTISFLIIL